MNRDELRGPIHEARKWIPSARLVFVMLLLYLLLAATAFVGVGVYEEDVHGIYISRTPWWASACIGMAYFVDFPIGAVWWFHENPYRFMIHWLPNSIIMSAVLARICGRVAGGRYRCGRGATSSDTKSPHI